MATRLAAFSCILFDLDGTLLDTLEDIADSANAALAEMGFPGHPTAAYRYMVGEGGAGTPDRGAAAEIARTLREPPPRFISLGDPAPDMQTAVAAGMYPIGVLWGFRERSELEQAGARTIVSSPAGLISLLGDDG